MSQGFSWKKRCNTLEYKIPAVCKQAGRVGHLPKMRSIPRETRFGRFGSPYLRRNSASACLRPVSFARR